MKTKRLFAVAVSDNTCNVLGREQGIYGKDDYSWASEPLNGGDGYYNMTEQEALETKAEFERYIAEHNLEWASVDIDFIEVPFAETMQDIADYWNESDAIDEDLLNNMIEANGWISDIIDDDRICHNDSEAVIILDNNQAIVIPQ